MRKAGGNIYNKYESKNPIVKLLMRKFFADFDSIVNPIKNQVDKALEIGCGEGYVTKRIHDMGINVEGADVSEDVIELARLKYPGIKFTVKSIYELSKYKEKYDIVFAIEVLEHLDSPRKAVEELKKVSRKYIFVSVPNEPFFRLANVLRLKYLRDFGNTPGHINHWTIGSYRRFLESCELEIIKFKVSTLWLMALCKVRKCSLPCRIE